jgi:hypothetical protein
MQYRCHFFVIPVIKTFETVEGNMTAVHAR